MATTKTTRTKAKAAGAKMPQDRLAKAEATGAPMTIEFRGVTISVEADALDDYEAMTMFASGLPDRLLSVLVPDPASNHTLLQTCRDESGRVRLSSVLEMTTEIMELLNAGN